MCLYAEHFCALILTQNFSLKDLIWQLGTKLILDERDVSRSEIITVIVGKSDLLSLRDFSLHGSDLILRDGDLRGGKERSLNKGKVGIVDHAAEEPDERLLELIVALGRDVVVLKVLLAVEGDLLGLDLAIADIDFVADKDDGDGLANTSQILVPLGDVGVSDARADIEHDDTAVATDVISVSESSKFLLTGGIPNIEDDVSVGGVERHGVHLDTKGGDVALLELTSQVTLDEGSLADTTITDEDEFELRDLLLLLCLNHSTVKLRLD